jgi:hypothetical protein
MLTGYNLNGLGLIPFSDLGSLSPYRMVLQTRQPTSLSSTVKQPELGAHHESPYRVKFNFTQQ